MRENENQVINGNKTKIVIYFLIGIFLTFLSLISFYILLFFIKPELAILIFFLIFR